MRIPVIIAVIVSLALCISSPCALAFGPPRDIEIPIEIVVQRSEIVLIAEVIELIDEDTPSAARRRFKVKPIEKINGPALSGKIVKCVYSQNKPDTDIQIKNSLGMVIGHRMPADTQISGSGLEFKVKKEEKLILLLGEFDQSIQSFQLLRIEPLKNKEMIKELCWEWKEPPEIVDSSRVIPETVDGSKVIPETVDSSRKK